MHDHLTAAVSAHIAAWSGVTIVAMTDAVNIAIVGGIVSVVTGVTTVYFAYKAKTISAESKEISAETGKAVNGKMEEFKRMAEEFYHAKGVSDEKTAAESKAGIEAIAKATGKAEAIANATEAIAKAADTIAKAAGKAEGKSTILPPIKPKG